MIRLSRYAETKVVTHAMRSERLSVNQLAAMAATPNVIEAWAMLQKTLYGAALREPPRFDAVSIELALRSAAAHRFQRAMRKLHGAAIHVASMLLSRWELDALQIALRLWHAHDLSPVVIESLQLLAPAIPFSAIARAEKIDDVAALLEHLPYATPLRETIPVYLRNHSIFYAEVALEKNYYRRILASIKALGGPDSRDGEQAIGAEIDLLNITWLSRLLASPPIDTPLSDYIVPGPSALSRRLVAADITPNALENAVARYLPSQSTTAAPEQSIFPRIALISELVREINEAILRKKLVQSPYSIGIVFISYLSIRLEMDNLCAIFAGKFLGMGEQSMLAHVRGAG